MPISAVIDAHIGTIDGSHPPAIRSISVDFDKTLAVHAKGFRPAGGDSSKRGRPRPRRAPAATRSSAKATATSKSPFPNRPRSRATGPIVLFNGGVHGGTTLLYVHTYVSVPAPTAVVATVKLTRIHRGHFGIHAVAEIPRIAGGAGSVTRFKLESAADSPTAERRRAT